MLDTFDVGEYIVRGFSCSDGAAISGGWGWGGRVKELSSNVTGPILLLILLRVNKLSNSNASVK